MLRGLRHSVKGINISWLALGLCFLILNIWLQINSLCESHAQLRDETRSRKIEAVWRVLAIYLTATFFNFVNLSVLVLNGRSWNLIDTITCLLVGVGTSVLVLRHRKALFSAAARGELAGLFKGTPQFFLAYSLLSAGGGSMRWDTNISQHFIGWLRLFQAIGSCRASRDPGSVASMWSEVWSMLSLCAITLAMIVGPYLTGGARH